MTQTPATLTSTFPPSNSPKWPDHRRRNSEGSIEMTHTIHDISVANHIGKYSDAIAVGPAVRAAAVTKTIMILASIGYAPSDGALEVGQRQRVASRLRAKPVKGA